MAAGVQHARHGAAFNGQRFHHGLADVQAGLIFDGRLHGQAVKLLVALHAGGLNGRSLGGVEQTEMDGGFIRDPPHFASQSVDFLDELAFGEPPDGRIAGHEGERIEIDVEQKRFGAHARRGQRRFAAGMPAADDQYVVRIGQNVLLTSCACRAAPDVAFCVACTE